MSYTRNFSTPILAKDGRRFETLADIVEFMKTLPALHLSNEHWDLAAQAIMKAAMEGSSQGDLDEAERLIRVCLQWERLLGSD